MQMHTTCETEKRISPLCSNHREMFFFLQGLRGLRWAEVGRGIEAVELIVLRPLSPLPNKATTDRCAIERTILSYTQGRWVGVGVAFLTKLRPTAIQLFWLSKNPKRRALCNLSPKIKHRAESHGTCVSLMGIILLLNTLHIKYL